ncbi:ImmA/IrrE family metallo-endopeptidase [Streptomyces sp. NBC_00670]|uniref:ImmA/IrrE family metallo-endopeptidase n=1 Tax=Streptomyces sp. NBC_00670 TaxID=2975804 RepID=UPI002E325398|nr:ImmA/IrrE family metallo-endopeptidase [Streptomyces sp. NBC_00670]
MNWGLAHRIASIAAVQAHRDLGIDRTQYVHVHRALGAAGVIGMAQPMPRLFGVYFSPADKGPAVMLNASLNAVTQRHTAAHELGHHRLGHRTAADEELDPALRWGNGSWPEEEKTAEAFAAWFLMPLPAVRAALERICGGRPSSPEHVYRVARELGTSYAGTVRHLVNLRLLDSGRAGQWAKIPPAGLRSSLAGGASLPAQAQVHVITAACAGQTVYADAGDVLVLHLDNARFDVLPKGLEPWTSDGTTPLASAVMTDELPPGEQGSVEITVPSISRPLRLTVVREAPRAGVDDTWPL